MKSILPYLWGKSKIVPKLVELFPKHVCFVDVFWGSMSVLLWKEKSLSKVEVYNDLDSEIVNLFQIIWNKNLFEELKQKWEFAIVSRKIFENLKNSNLDKLSKVERAFRTLYLYKYAFTSRRNSETSFNYWYRKNANAPDPKNIYWTIKELHDRIKNVNFENLSYDEILKKYDAKDTFFYVDPPYLIPWKNTKYYKHNIDTEEWQITIKNEIDKIKGKVMISYPDTDFYRNLYKDYYINTINIHYSVGTCNNAQGKQWELIITNYELI